MLNFVYSQLGAAMLNVADAGRGIIDRPTRRTVFAEIESEKQRESGRSLSQLGFIDDSFFQSGCVTVERKRR